MLGAVSVCLLLLSVFLFNRLLVADKTNNTTHYKKQNYTADISYLMHSLLVLIVCLSSQICYTVFTQSEWEYRCKGLSWFFNLITLSATKLRPSSIFLGPLIHIGILLVISQYYSLQQRTHNSHVAGY